MSGKYSKDDCIRLLREKHQLLLSQNIARYPQRSDFDEAEVVAIKAFLGPWPRALEAAGIKSPRDDHQVQRTREKRIRARRRRNEARREAKREQNSAKADSNQ